MKIMENAGNIVATCLETACQFTIGQFFIRTLDRTIGIVEKTAQWSLPSNEIISEESEKLFNRVELVRPLPWILFLPGLVILRGFRFTWNVGAFVIGYSEIYPDDIVQFLQKLRRRLRAIRTNGIKQMRKIKPGDSRDQSLGLNEAKQSLLRSIHFALSTLSCFNASKMKSSSPPMKIRIPMNYDSTSVLDDKSTIESTTLTPSHEAKRKYSEVSSDDPTSDEESECEDMALNEELSHYALLNDSYDPDFDPQNCIRKTDDFENDPDFDPHNCTGDTDDLEESIQDENELDVEEIDKLKEEAGMTVMEVLEKTKPEMSKEEILATINGRLANIEKKTAKNGNGNCVKNNSNELLQDFHSPCKSIEDVDTIFYSPISSTSTSPEREVNANDIGIIQNRFLGVDGAESAKLIMNETVDINHDTNNKNEHEKKDDKQNDLSSIKSKQQRQNLKGKRGTHGNRKKKL